MDIQLRLRITLLNIVHRLTEHGNLTFLFLILYLYKLLYVKHITYKRMYLSDYFTINHDMIIKVNHTIFKVHKQSKLLKISVTLSAI